MNKSILSSCIIGILLVLITVSGAATLFNKVSNMSVLLVLAILIFPICFVVIKYPEISFALFINAGMYKADERLNFIQQYLDLTVLFGVLTVVGVIYGIITRKIRFILPHREVLLPFILIAILGLVSLTYTTAPIYGTDKLVRFLTLTSLSVFLPFLVFQDISKISRYFQIFILLALIMILDVLNGGISSGRDDFQSALGSNYIGMTRTTGVAVIVMMFYFILNSRNIIVSLLYLCVVQVLILGGFLSGGRGPVISLFISILIAISYILLSRGKMGFIFNRNKSFLKVITLMILPIVITLVLLSNYADYFTAFFRRIELFQSVQGIYDAGRIERFRPAIDIIMSFPKGITGEGIGGFSAAYHTNRNLLRGDYPHNIFLEIGSELGWFGLLAIIFMIYRSFTNSLLLFNTTNITNKCLAVTLLSLLIYGTLNSTISGDINDNRVLFTIMGLICALKNDARRRDDNL